MVYVAPFSCWSNESLMSLIVSFKKWIPWGCCPIFCEHCDRRRWQTMGFRVCSDSLIPRHLDGQFVHWMLHEREGRKCETDLCTYHIRTALACCACMPTAVWLHNYIILVLRYSVTSTQRCRYLVTCVTTFVYNLTCSCARKWQPKFEVMGSITVAAASRHTWAPSTGPWATTTSWALPSFWCRGVFVVFCQIGG
jgi:hypothetical protein